MNWSWGSRPAGGLVCVTRLCHSADDSDQRVPVLPVPTWRKQQLRTEAREPLLKLRVGWLAAHPPSSSGLEMHWPGHAHALVAGHEQK